MIYIYIVMQYIIKYLLVKNKIEKQNIRTEMEKTKPVSGTLTITHMSNDR
jgi:hypothetical protein